MSRATVLVNLFSQNLLLHTNDIVLAEGVDYEIKYEDDCGELGWHYAYIKGIGNFNGTDSLSITL